MQEIEQALSDRRAEEHGSKIDVVILVMVEAAIEAGFVAAIGGVGDETGGFEPLRGKFLGESRGDDSSRPRVREASDR